MITNIKLKGMYNVGVDETNHIDVNGTSVLLKDIPFVRYDFEKYDAEEVEFIKKTMEKFNMSTHLIQIYISDRVLTDLDNTAELHSKVAKYLYINVENRHLADNALDTETLNIATQACTACRFDRVMLVDKTTSMDMASAKKIIKLTSKTLGVSESKIGICSSPLCMSDNLACLTAVTARELAAIYATSKDVTTPSANHQDMNCCGCMRFFTVTQDIPAPAGKPKKTKSSSDKDAKPKAEKAPSKPKVQKVFSLNDFA